MFKSNKNSNRNASVVPQIQQSRTVFINEQLKNQTVSNGIKIPLPGAESNKDASIINVISDGSTTITEAELNTVLSQNK